VPASERSAALEDVARALARWHAAGFRHGNAYPKNFLTGTAPGDVVPIGCPAARFVRPGPRLDRRAAKDLAQLAAGSPVVGLDALAQAYRPGDARVLRLARPRLERILEKKRARLASPPLREPGGAPRPVPLPAAYASGKRTSFQTPSTSRT
jgi:hypothetical protein